MKDFVPSENINRNTTDIDLKDTIGIVELINQEDIKVALEVQKVLPEIAKAVDLINESFIKGGRLLYFGAGTSGRLGVLDASECPPTFNTDPQMVQGIIAGGDSALRNAIEGAEDSFDMAQKDFEKMNISKNDAVVVISASGNANYVIDIEKLSKQIGASTIAVTSNPEAKIKDYADCFICVQTGAEIITGSTRMKAGTAQKMVLNMLTTASMVKMGKVYKNYMIDVKPTNIKLKSRAVRFVSQIASVDEEIAKEALILTNYDLKRAVLKLKYNLSAGQINDLMKKHNGVLRKIFNSLDKQD